MYNWKFIFSIEYSWCIKVNSLSIDRCLYKLYLFVVIGQDDVKIYTDQIDALVKDFHENGPGSVDENLDLGLQMLEVRFY